MPPPRHSTSHCTACCILACPPPLVQAFPPVPPPAQHATCPLISPPLPLHRTACPPHLVVTWKGIPPIWSMCCTQEEEKRGHDYTSTHFLFGNRNRIPDSKCDPLRLPDSEAACLPSRPRLPPLTSPKSSPSPHPMSQQYGLHGSSTLGAAATHRPRRQNHPTPGPPPSSPHELTVQSAWRRLAGGNGRCQRRP